MDAGARVMDRTPLVTTEWLERHLDDPDIRIIEVSLTPDGEKYRAGHIPGAIWKFWKALCWHETDRELVTPAEMAERLGRMGIGPEHTIVLCGDPIQFGAYAYWALSMAGHKHLCLLDGGRKKWTAEGRPLTQDIPRLDPVAYPVPSGDSAPRIGRDDVRDNLKKPGRLLLDLRSPEEYSGERVTDYSFKFDHGAERAGHIPGAVHLYYKDLINEDESFKSPDELRKVLAAAGVTPEKEIVAYCRLSHRATLGWLALQQLLNFENVKVYDGSWTEWGSIVGFPVEKSVAAKPQDR
jgi:thiosulfate/3-mercaptopyruvate sulfurtransferase